MASRLCGSYEAYEDEVVKGRRRQRHAASSLLTAHDADRQTVIAREPFFSSFFFLFFPLFQLRVKSIQHRI